MIYLRHNLNTKDELEAEISFPNGEIFIYKVPIIKVQNYTKDIIFQKKLLFLLPFYVMRYEKEAEQIEHDTGKLDSLLQEYEDIRNRLLESLGDGKHGREYVELVELITRISDYIFREEKKARRGVSEKMGGKVLELKIDKAIDTAYAQGRVQTLYTDAGFTIEQIAEKVNLPIEEVIGILRELKLISEKEEALV